MKTMTDMRQYIEANGHLPPDCVLGYIAWFSVNDAGKARVIHTISPRSSCVAIVASSTARAASVA